MKATRELAMGVDVPDQVGQYELGQCLGSGAFGAVFKGYDPSIYREVAIKFSFNGSDGDSKKSATAQRSFLTEAAAISKLAHPHIIALYDRGIHKNLNYLVMEYVPGTQLTEFGKGRTPLPTRRVLEIIYESAQALNYSHGKGIIHRDIKPSNIMLTPQNVAKILDFGIAISTHQEFVGSAGVALGTPNYMSPEQVLGVALGPQSDLYSLATVLFEMLTGRQLFVANTIQALFRSIISQPPPRLSDIRPDLPRELSDILAKALHKDADKRYQSVAEFAEGISIIADSMLSSPVTNTNSTDESGQTLRDLALFKPMGEADIDVVIKSCRLLSYKPGEVALEQAVSDDNLYIVLDGDLVMRCNGCFMQAIGRGEYFGEAGFIKRAKSIAAVQALSAVTVCVVNRKVFKQVSPAMQAHYYTQFSTRLTERLAMKKTPSVDYLI